MVKVCLCMIVKNESNIIKRCLDTAKPFIDFISICDTGSTDGTPTIIRNWGKNNNIKTTVHTPKYNLIDILKYHVTKIEDSFIKIQDEYKEAYDQFKNYSMKNLSKILNNKEDSRLQKYERSDINKIFKLLGFREKLLKTFENLFDEIMTNMGDLRKQYHDMDRITNIIITAPERVNSLSTLKHDLNTIIDNFDGNLFYPLNKKDKYDTTFKNFGHNRTQSFDLAKETYPEADYCLLIDADMMLRIPNFDKNTMDKPAYHLYQIAGGLKYVNIRIISTKMVWKCVGVTHEYWDSRPDCQKTTLDDSMIYIEDVGDGGCKDDKFIRDIRLLEKGLKEEKFDSLKTRYKYYLAQSYKDIGQPFKAIKWYKERIKDGSWEEENWHAHYTIGKCYINIHKGEKSRIEKLEKQLEKEKDSEKKEDIQKEIKEHQEKSENYEGLGIKWLNMAYNRRPYRVEPIMFLATFYREKGMNGAAYMYASIARQPYCQRGLKDSLFVEHRLYNLLPDFEISIVAYYVQRYKEGYEACIRILSSENVPQGILNTTKSNLNFYKNVYNPLA